MSFARNDKTQKTKENITARRCSRLEIARWLQANPNRFPWRDHWHVWTSRHHYLVSKPTQSDPDRANMSCRRGHRRSTPAEGKALPEALSGYKTWHEMDSHSYDNRSGSSWLRCTKRAKLLPIIGLHQRLNQDNREVLVQNCGTMFVYYIQTSQNSFMGLEQSLIPVNRI